MNLRSVNVFRPIGRDYHPAETAWHTTVEAIKPLLHRAKKEGLFLRNRMSGRIFTHSELGKLLLKRQFVQGPSHWWLVDAQGRRVA